MLPAAGTYVIRVSATNLATTGSYDLNLECMVLRAGTLCR